MKQLIPFTKEITFKTKIGELTSISLDNDLELKGEDLISGNFYVKGTYKMLRTSELQEEYSYKIPCEIAISPDYETFDAIVDIDDFNYEIINEETLKINIIVLIDNLEKKEIVINEIEIPQAIEQKEILEETESLQRSLEEEPNLDEPDAFEDLELFTNIEFESLDLEDKNIKTTIVTDERTEIIDPINIISETNPNLLNEDNNEETYVTYSVYLVREEDTLNNILDKYNITMAEFCDYNDEKNFEPGNKLIIPNKEND